MGFKRANTSVATSWLDKLDCFPDTFCVTVIQFLMLITFNALIYAWMQYFIWNNDYYDKIFNYGFQCGDHEYSAYFIFISMQISGYCLFIPSFIFCLFDYYLEKHNQLQHYKVLYPPPRGEQKSVSWRLYKKAVFLAGINSICALIVTPLIYIPIMQYRGNCDHLFWDHENDRNHYSIYYDIALLIFKIVYVANNEN
eukprot:358135_1